MWLSERISPRFTFSICSDQIDIKGCKIDSFIDLPAYLYRYFLTILPLIREIALFFHLCQRRTNYQPVEKVKLA